MKRFVISLALALVLLGTLTPAISAKGERHGSAVKVDLTEAYLNGSVVGSAILNTTSNNKLITVVNIDNVPDIENYHVNVRVWYSPPVIFAPPDAFKTFTNVLSTNSRGHGNARLEFDINPPQENESIWVRVTVRPNPGGLPLRPYYISIPLNLKIPLK